MKFTPVIKSLILTVGVSVIAFVWVALLSINSMPGWYYGTLLFLPLFAVMWTFLFVTITKDPNTKEPK